MKEQILKLRNQGKSYRDIEKILKCSRSLISYYVNPHGKESMLNRQNKNRYNRRSKYKQMLGGKCCICGYNKCLDALQFHHRDPSKKEFHISDGIWSIGKTIDEEKFKLEIQKCDLVCANCHFELHSKNNYLV